MTHRGTISRTIAIKLGHNLLVVAALVVVCIFGMVGQDKDSYARPAVADTAVELAEAHGCADQANPTHVVVTYEGETKYAGQRMTDKAIEQDQYGIDHGITHIHRFCA